MPAAENNDLIHDNTAEVMMEAGLSFVRAGDREAALSFFRDAAVLFREQHDERSAEVAQAWVDAGLHPNDRRPDARKGKQTSFVAAND